MRKLFVISFLFVASSTFGASRYLVGAGTGNWNSTTNWSTSDGGGSGASFPTSSDAVFITSNSSNANITINVPSACASFSVSGTYTGTLTANSQFTISGAITFISGMTIAGTDTLIMNTSSNITSGGKTWTGSIRFSGTAPQYLLIDNWTVAGNLTIKAVTNSYINGVGKTFSVGGNLYTTNGSLYGTSTLILNGTGTWLGNSQIDCNITINTAGTITLSGQQNLGLNIVFTITSGTITCINSQYLRMFYAMTLTINESGITFSEIDYTGNTIFNGSNGFSVGSLYSTASGNTLTLQASNTYSITPGVGESDINLRLHGTSGSPCVIASSDGTTKTILTLSTGTNQSVIYATATRIDGSGGVAIVNAYGTNTSCLNWTGRHWDTGLVK